jgi:hypothetical protein
MVFLMGFVQCARIGSPLTQAKAKLHCFKQTGVCQAISPDTLEIGNLLPAKQKNISQLFCDYEKQCYLCAVNCWLSVEC